MCGIAGYIGTRKPGQGNVKAAKDALRHRGPNASGDYMHDGQQQLVSLIHTRLSIIDLDTRADQPYRVGSHVLIFNGEIYNYLELRAELETAGLSFHTASDTEVLAKALHHWGTGALDRLEGMWALAWYNEADGALLLSRDRFGEKPLYLWQREGGLYFSSEVKGLAALAGSWPELNHNHLLRYLVNGYKALYKVEENFFKDVTELPAATNLTLSSSGKKSFERYWMPRFTENRNLSYQDAVESVREGLISAVAQRLRSDVPLGFCMSGGIDSNALIAIAKRIKNYDVHGFTIVNSDARYEEQDLVNHVVEELGIGHTSIPVDSAGFIRNLELLVKAHDAPVYTISYYVHWQLMQAMAADGCKVAISGTGADELFTGYYDHHNLYLYEVAKDRELHEKSLNAWQKYQAPIVRNPHLQDPNLYLKDSGFRDHIYLNNDVFAGYLHEHWSEPFTETNHTAGLLRNRMLNEMFGEAVPVILHEDDLNAMSCSIENRSPFLDRQLFETAYAIPDRYLVQDGKAKAVLRDAMRGVVPDPVLDCRRKVGFNAPILELLNVKDAKVRSYLLDDSPVFELVKKDKIEALLEQDELPNSASKFLFYFLNMKMFLEQHRGHA